MAALCSFDQSFTGSADDLVAKAKAGIEQAGGTLNGDATGGSFSIPTSRFTSPIAGTYAVHDQTAHFDITNKPGFVTCARIESGIAEMAQGGPPPAALLARPPAPQKKKVPKKKKAAKKKAKAPRKAKVTKKKSAKKSRPARRAKRGSKKR